MSNRQWARVIEQNKMNNMKEFFRKQIGRQRANSNGQITMNNKK